MSVSSIINSATGKLYASVIPAGGGTNFTQEGQLIYGGQAPDYADQLLNIGNAGQVLSVAGGIPTWQDAGGSGLISANLPLIEEADPAPNSKISINFSANVGEIPYGTGVAKVVALTKNSKWADEEEFRMVLSVPPIDDGPVVINNKLYLLPHMLTSVYFGFKIDPMHLQVLLKSIMKTVRHVRKFIVYGGVPYRDVIAVRF